MLSLDKMVGDPNVRTLDFFEAYAEDLPPPLNVSLRTIAAALFTDHKRPRLGTLFLVQQCDAEGTIRRAVPNDDATGWRKAIEVQAGFTFAGANVPSSYELIRRIAPSVELKESVQDRRRRDGTATVSDEMEEAGRVRDDPISAACFTNFGTDPKFSVVD